MTKIMTKILLVVMIVNAVLANFTFSVFAANQPKANSKINFEWNKETTLDESLNVVPRNSNSDEVFLSWDIDKIGNTENNSGTYTLTYPIADDKEIEFKVTKKSNKSIVEYKVNGKNDVNNGKKPLSIYKDTAYVPANKTNFPDTDIFKLDST